MMYVCAIVRIWHIHTYVYVGMFIFYLKTWK